MATHAFIGIEDEGSGKIKGIYCHFDGYPDGVGSLLKKHYTDEDKVKALVSLGSISVLRPSLGDKHEFEDLETPAKNGWTTAYHRDRGEELVIDEFEDLYQVEGDYEYAYVLTQGCWLYKSFSNKSAWLPLV